MISEASKRVEEASRSRPLSSFKANADNLDEGEKECGGCTASASLDLPRIVTRVVIHQNEHHPIIFEEEDLATSSEQLEFINPHTVS